MKLTTVLKIGGVVVPIVDDVLTLSLSTAGRAVFTVISENPLRGHVEFLMGYDPAKLQRWFVGYVENSMAVNAKQQRLMCRELVAALDRPIALNLRHVTLSDVLKAIAATSGIEFVLPNKPLIFIAPYFYSWGGGCHVMDSLAQVFSIDRPLWQQQGDGRVYVGSWLDSYWHDKPVTIGAEWMTEHGYENQAKVAALPKLRPGVLLARGEDQFIITKVQLSGVAMHVTWSRNPWGIN